MKKHPTAASALLAFIAAATNWYWSRTTEHEFSDMSSTTSVTIDGPAVTAFVYAILSILMVWSTYRTMRRCLDKGIHVPSFKRMFRFGDLWPTLLALPLLFQIRSFMTITEKEDVVSHYARGYGSDASSYLLMITVFCIILIHIRAGWSRCAEPIQAGPKRWQRGPSLRPLES